MDRNTSPKTRPPWWLLGKRSKKYNTNVMRFPVFSEAPTVKAGRKNDREI